MGSPTKDIFALLFVAIQSGIKNYLSYAGQLQAQGRGKRQTIREADLLLEAPRHHF